MESEHYAVSEYRRRRQLLIELIAQHEHQNTDRHADPAYRFASCACSEWASAVWRATGEFPANHRLHGCIA